MTNKSGGNSLDYRRISFSFRPFSKDSFFPPFPPLIYILLASSRRGRAGIFKCLIRKVPIGKLRRFVNFQLVNSTAGTESQVLIGEILLTETFFSYYKDWTRSVLLMPLRSGFCNSRASNFNTCNNSQVHGTEFSVSTINSKHLTLFRT